MSRQQSGIVFQAAAAATFEGPWRLPAWTWNSNRATRTGGPDDDDDDEAALVRRLMPVVAILIVLAHVFS